MDVKNLISEAKSFSIPVVKYVEKIPLNKYSYTLELINEINDTRENHDDSLLESLLIIASRDGLNKEYTELLCQLLMEAWHYSHEDIVMMLKEIKDIKSINCLFQTALVIPDYDDGRSLAKKCIWALGAINTQEARQKMTLLANTDDKIIRDAAILQLGHMTT